MSAARRVSREQPVPAASTRNVFPGGSHLLITCPSKILSWDTTGISTVFRSSKGGIVAAREAKDGSGVLAVADKRIVVLHDTKRGQERSWGLEGDQDEVRHLEYTADAKSLFLSTTLTANIQRYSTERSRLLDPTNIHASPPVALALSPTGHAMVSASDCPPTAYLKNMAHNSSPILIESRVSTAAVCVIAFHPERANIFLMAFRDGSVAAYDSTRIGRSEGGQFADQQGVSRGQISCLMKLHRATTETSKFASISGAAFLPGFKTRAITVGGDGRCRIVDFAGKGEVLRTWHAKAPVTSVSVLSLKDRQASRSPFVRNRGSHTIGGPTSTENIMAVGRADGAVHLYDSVGILLEERMSSENGEIIISVEWIKGPSPRPIPEPTPIDIDKHAPPLPTKNPRPTMNLQSSPASIRPGVGRGAESVNEHGKTPPRRFTIHPDEAEEGTVRHTPLAGQPQLLPATSGAYIDLFSPVKPVNTKIEESSKQRVASPSRSRPRISSQTFIKSPVAGPSTEKSQMTSQRNIALFPSTDSTDDNVSPKTLNSIVAISHKPEPSPAHQRIPWKPSNRRRSRKSIGIKTVPSQPNNNAKVLAELRKMSTSRTIDQNGDVLTSFHAPGTRKSSGKGAIRAALRRPAEHVDTDLESLDALRVYDSARRERKWVVDSEQGDGMREDIWLTSDSEGDNTRRTRKRKPIAMERPPARQTSRSRITSKGTMSTAGTVPIFVDASTTLRSLDGSTEDGEDAMHTARSRVSPSGNFSPSSHDVRQLFPRTSSLSPRKHKYKAGSPAKRSQRRRDVTATDRRTLREVTLNTAHVRQLKSPWAKMKASKASVAPVLPTQAQPQRPLQSYEKATPGTGTDGTTDDQEYDQDSHCAVCGPTQARVAGLEGEVARLRGEVLALKAALRRNGLQVPKMH